MTAPSPTELVRRTTSSLLSLLDPIATNFLPLVVAGLLIGLLASPAVSDEYAALDGVDEVKAVFDVSSGAAETINVVFWAVKNVYEDQNVSSLAKPTKVAVVFHGPAVKLISTDTKNLSDSEIKRLAGLPAWSGR